MKAFWTKGRRVLAVVLSVCMLMALVPMALSATATEASMDVVTDDGAWIASTGYDDYADWTINLQTTGTEGYDGSNGIVAVMGKGNAYVAGNTGAPYISSPGTNLTANTAYTLSFYVRSTAAQNTLRIEQWSTAQTDGVWNESGSPTVLFTQTVSSEWTHYTVSFTAAGATRFRFLLSAAEGEQFYFDNVHVYDSSYQTVVTYDPIVSIETAVPTETVSEVATLQASDGGIKYQWYVNGSTFSADNYIKIVETGADEAGSLHVYQIDDTVGDMSIALYTDWISEAYTYTLKMKVKGDLGGADQVCRFYPYGNNDSTTNLMNKAGVETVSDWTELTWNVAPTSGAAYFIFNFSKYNWATDFYVDNIQLINNQTGVDMLGGAGNFGSETQVKKIASMSANSGVSDQWYENTSGVVAGYNDAEIVRLDDNGVMHMQHTAAGTVIEEVTCAYVSAVYIPGNVTLAGNSYTLSVDVKGSFGWIDSNNGLQWYDQSTWKAGGMIINSDDTGSNGAYTLEDWTTFTAPVTFVEDSTGIQILLTNYAGLSDIYVDNIKLLDAEGNDVLNGAGTFDLAEQPVVPALGTGIFSEDNVGELYYAEVVSQGSSDDNPGSLYMHTQDAAGDLRIRMETPDAQTGVTYTLSLKIKGTFGYLDATSAMVWDAHNSTYGYIVNSEDSGANGSWTLSDWTTFTSEVTFPEGGDNLLLTLGAYTWGSDIYVDNIQLLDPAGNDLLYGNGDFYNKKYTLDTIENEWTTVEKADAESVLEIVEDGHNEFGALRFKKEGSVGELTAAIQPYGMVAGQDYTLTMWIKGKAPTFCDDNNNIRWQEGENDTNYGILFNSTSAINSDGWTKITSTVNFTNANNPLYLRMGTYAYGADFMIDNVTLTDASGYDVLQGRGNFYKQTRTESISGNGTVIALPNGNFENLADGSGALGENQILSGMQVSVGDNLDAKVYFNMPTTQIIPKTDLEGKTLNDLMSSRPVGAVVLMFDESDEGQAALATYKECLGGIDTNNAEALIDLFVDYYVEINSDGYYTELKDIAAKDMSEVYTFAMANITEWESQYMGLVHVPDADIYYTKSVSVADYAKRLLMGDYSTEVKDMAAAMLNYGQASLEYFQTYNENVSDPTLLAARDNVVLDTDEIMDGKRLTDLEDPTSALSVYRATMSKNPAFADKIATAMTTVYTASTAGQWYYVNTSSDTSITYAEMSETGKTEAGAMRIKADATNRGSWRVATNVSIPAGTYKVSAWMKLESGSIKGVQYTYGDSSAYAFSSYPTTTGEWVLAETGEITVDADTTYFALRFSGSSFAGSDDVSLLIDNVSIVNTATGANILDKAVGGFYTMEANPLTTTTVYTPNAWVSSPDAAELGDWYLPTYSGAMGSNTVEVAADGCNEAGSLKYVAAKANSFLIEMKSNNIPMGDYTLKYNIKVTSGAVNSGFTCYLGGEYQSITGGQIDVCDWTEKTASVTVASESGINFFGFRLSGSSGVTEAGTTFYVDNIQLLDASGNDVLGGLGNMCTTTYESNGATYYPTVNSYSVILETTTGIRLYFNNADNMNNWTYTIDGVAATPTLATKNNRYFLEGGGISATDLDNTYTVEALYNGTAAVRVKLSALSWAASAIKGDDPVTVNLAKAMYYYSAAAEALA